MKGYCDYNAGETTLADTDIIAPPKEWRESFTLAEAMTEEERAEFWDNWRKAGGNEVPETR